MEGAFETCSLCDRGYYRVGDGQSTLGPTAAPTAASTLSTDTKLDLCKRCKKGMVCEDYIFKSRKDVQDLGGYSVTLENAQLKDQYWRTSKTSSRIEKCPMKKSCESYNDTQKIRVSYNGTQKNQSSSNETYDDDDFFFDDQYYYDDFYYDDFSYDDFRRRLSSGSDSSSSSFFDDDEGEFRADAGEALCKDGHHGPLCAVCNRHHYRSGNTCKKCSPGSEAANVILALAVIVGFGVAVAIAVRKHSLSAKYLKDQKKKIEKKVKGCWQEAEETKEAGKETVETLQNEGTSGVVSDETPGIFSEEALFSAETGRFAKTAIKQMLGMWSVLSNTPWILDVNYPKIFDKVLAFLSNVFSFDFTIAVDCAADRIGFLDRLLIDTLGPFILCAFIVLIAVVVTKVVRCRAGPAEKAQGEVNELSDKIVMNTCTLILFIVFLSYTTASTQIFRALRPCHKFEQNYHGSNQYMKDDYGTSCKSNRYQVIQGYAILMMFIYPIGVPLLTFAFLWRHRNTLNPDVRVEPELEPLGAVYRAKDSTSEQRDLAESINSCTELSLRRSGFALLGRSSDAHDPLEDLQDRITKAKIEERDGIIARKGKSAEALMNKEDPLNPELAVTDERKLVDRPELFAFMYSNYEPEYWWFECFDYIRRLLLTGILVVFEEGSATQGLFGVLVALAVTQVYSWTRPFPEGSSDRLAESAQWSTFFTFLAALMIVLKVETNSKSQTFFGALLIFLQFMPLAVGAAVKALGKRLFKVGDTVSVKSKDEEEDEEPEDRQGTITKVNQDGTYDIEFEDDGTTEERVKVKRISPMGNHVAQARDKEAEGLRDKKESEDSESSPTSPLSPNAPPQDEEQPAASPRARFTQGLTDFISGRD